MSALAFREIGPANAFCRVLNSTLCVDASAQTYKKNCPPVVLTKLPLITSESMIDALVVLMEKALAQVRSEGTQASAPAGKAAPCASGRCSAPDTSSGKEGSAHE